MSKDESWITYLLERAKYAIRSQSKELVYEVYGMAKGMRMVNAITKEEMWTMTNLLVRDTMNNGRRWSKFH